MIFGIPDATLAAIVTLLSGAIAWILKEWRDSSQLERQANIKPEVRIHDEYDFAGRLREEVVRLQILIDSAYKDLQKMDVQADALREENLGLSKSVYESRRENLRLKNENAELTQEVDRLHRL